MSILDIKQLLAKRVLDSTVQNDSPKETIVVSNTLSLGIRLALKESDVGICEFINDLPGFSGTIKERYSDFSVHEIDTDGKMVVLDSFKLPDESAPKAGNTSLLSTEHLTLLESLMAENSTVDSVEIDVTKNSRDERKDMHQFIKDSYGQGVVSNTSDKDDKKFIIVSKAKKGNRDDRWPGHLPKNLHFTLCKSNIDTSHALNIIAKKMHLKQDRFNIAGTKDKRALTTQRVSVKSVRAGHLRKIAPTLRMISIGNFEYKDLSMRLGDLKGNNFQIALRNVDASDEIIENSLTQLKDNGFINYFGMQRFGTSADSPTHLVGKFLIKQQYGHAFESIMKPRTDFDSPELKSARDIYAKTRDAGQALGALRDKRSIEGQLLFGLKINGPNAFANAFDKVPRNMRFLYIHAYQSYVWNRAVSRRIKKFGHNVLEGDLVLIDKAALLEVLPEEIINEPEEPEEDKKPQCPVRPITKEEVNKYSIYDILMPLPGHSNIYPKNEIAEVYKEILAEDGLTTESFVDRRKYSSEGGYRDIIKKPQNLSWRVVNYEKDDIDLIMSDKDKMDGKSLPTSEGAKKAVIISMDLEKSTYATMALREILRCDTSWASQAAQSQKRKKAEGEEAGSVKKLKTTNGGCHGAGEEAMAVESRNIQPQ